MEQEYNWELILKVSIIFSILEAIIFYISIIDVWKWISLVAALSLTGLIVYVNDKRRSSVFTSIGIVFLVVLVVRFLRVLGLI